MRNEPNKLARHAHAQAQQQRQTHNQSGQQHYPGIMQKPGIPAQQMQRTGTRKQACGRGTDQTPLAEHAQHAPQTRSIAW